MATRRYVNIRLAKTDRICKTVYHVLDTWPLSKAGTTKCGVYVTGWFPDRFRLTKATALGRMCKNCARSL